MEQLSVLQEEELRDITKKYIKVIKSRFNINLQEIVRDINKVIYIAEEISEDDYKAKKYLEHLLKYDIHLISECSNITELNELIYKQINIKCDEQFIKNIINNFLKKNNLI
jgi:hypothetical protein